MKSKKKKSKSKTKSKSKKKSAKVKKSVAALKRLNDFNYLDERQKQNIHVESSFQSFIDEQCGCEQPNKGCLDENLIHQDGICEDSDCKNEICLMERSLKAWEESGRQVGVPLLKQEKFDRPFWNEDIKENVNKSVWQKIKQFFGFRS